MKDLPSFSRVLPLTGSPLYGLARDSIGVHAAPSPSGVAPNDHYFGTRLRR
jgi:hypothetical protein